MRKTVALTSTITIALLATMLITTALTFSPETVDAAASKKKPAKCNNVKIHANVTSDDLEANQTLIGVVHLDSKTVGKTVMVEENETSVTLPFNFKKLDPCPALGEMFHGFVNGTEFSGNLTSIKKPNTVDVDLSS